MMESMGSAKASASVTVMGRPDIASCGHRAVRRAAGFVGRSGHPARACADRRRAVIRRAVATVLLSMMVCVGVSMVAARDAVSSPATTPVESYTVRPGDTLWSYASSITPEGGDVSQRVDELMRLNHLDSPSLRTGQRIVVPTDER